MNMLETAGMKMYVKPPPRLPQLPAMALAVPTIVGENM
jgi:hypothetical protein